MTLPVTKLVIRSDTPGLDRLPCPACGELPYNHPRMACGLNYDTKTPDGAWICHCVATPADVVFAALAFNDHVIVPDDLNLEEYAL